MVDQCMFYELQLESFSQSFAFAVRKQASYMIVDHRHRVVLVVFLIKLALITVIHLRFHINDESHECKLSLCVGMGRRLCVSSILYELDFGHVRSILLSTSIYFLPLITSLTDLT